RGMAKTKKRRAFSRGNQVRSRSEPRAAPRAAQQRPKMPLLVGSKAVLRRLKRSSKPQDWSGPSNRRARQASLLEDMLCEAFDELVDVDIGYGYFLSGIDGPSCFQGRVVGFKHPD